MNREETAEAIKVMQYYVDGGDVGDRGPIRKVFVPVWSWNDDAGTYTIEKRSGECYAAINENGSVIQAHWLAEDIADGLKYIKIKWEEI